MRSIHGTKIVQTIHLHHWFKNERNRLTILWIQFVTVALLLSHSYHRNVLPKLMKSFLIILIGLACSVCSADYVTLEFDTDMGETIVFSASPEIIGIRKLGQIGGMRKYDDTEAYRQIREAVQAFAKKNSLSLRVFDEAKSRPRNIRLSKEGSNGFNYSMVGKIDDIEILINDFREQFGETEVNRFINKFIVEPDVTHNFDRLRLSPT